MNKVREFIYNILRNYAKKSITGNLGKIVEDDEKLTCYVKRSKIKKEKYKYTIACFGIGKKKKELADVYELNKPICYVIDGIDLKKHIVYIFGYNNCEVIIKNCNFGLDLCIYVNGKCTLDNTNITSFSYLTIGASELVIKNMDSEQIKVISSESNIWFAADYRIDIMNSNFGKNKYDISLFAPNELNLINSRIIGKVVKCESKKITADEKSSLTASDKVDIKTEDFNAINIAAPNVVLNGTEIYEGDKSVRLKKLTDQLTLKRLELIKILKRIKGECESINTQKISEYQEGLNGQTVDKVLRKTN